MDWAADRKLSADSKYPASPAQHRFERGGGSASLQVFLVKTQGKLQKKKKSKTKKYVWLTARQASSGGGLHNAELPDR